MASFFDQLNLRPAERRALVVVGMALFLVVNLVWVWPRFGDWSKIQKRLRTIDNKLANYSKLINEKSLYEAKLRNFEGDSQDVPAEEQVTTFIRTFTSQAAQCGVVIRGTARTTIKTNENFIENIQRVPVLGDETALVNYLYKLGDANSAVPIRVKELSLHPERRLRQKLEGDVTLVASFQRRLSIHDRLPAASSKARASKTAAAGRRPSPVPANRKPPARSSARTKK